MWHPKDTNHAQNRENFFCRRVTQNAEAHPIGNRTSVQFLHISYLSKDAISKVKQLILRQINAWANKKYNTGIQRTTKEREK
jgi:hypothetical protein